MESKGDAPGQLDSRQRKALKAKAQQLKPTLHVGRNGVSDRTTEQLRQMFAGTDLIKVRVQDGDARQVEAIGRELAAGVAGHFVARVGKVVLLYKLRCDSP